MNILITGASRGIGFHTAIAFCRQKTDRLILVARNSQKLASLKQECKKINPHVTILTVPFDIENLLSGDVQFLKLINDFTDSIDILINNAGLLESKQFELFSSESAQKIFNVNFFAPAQLIRQLLPLLKKSSNAHVVNISSMGGFQGSVKFPGLSYYSASKAALANLTECLAEEYKETAIKFNCLALGAVQTEMLSEAFPGYHAPIEPDAMADFIAEFASNGQRFFNGKIIPVALSTP
ncbi:MAG: short-chain dehydrogenase [Bacteroidetes bacterium RIFOXYA12_FULL_35_11]|nr:MAG: short-chain dehydrogenase [Bacteroidetes bacterium GWF2_35_48]OFY75274.1 MAG: short-chain dehydrogenase [Bacteroidetes bacterium RIFOXYA12_FULL_35_11]OFY96935.1 MAG: short-chain dehydrogenase [Bacteroidetes bacterium RIFOXYB2_FULL_35_7]OFY97735.1 MAG: short-chain dehydrogenase [Bacteroidetes bacterium RIFOXYC12_FULL_35_7]HBX51005.1 short-chain dehydrogenase [Bacteroidales bacterium]